MTRDYIKYIAALLLREAMTPVQALGAALIVGGAVFGELAGLRQKRTGGPPA